MHAKHTQIILVHAHAILLQTGSIVLFYGYYGSVSCMLKGQYHGRYHDFGQKFTKFKL